MVNSYNVSNYLQQELRRRNIQEVKAVEAASWLDSAGMLVDRKERRGAPLRNMLRCNTILGSELRGKRWFIKRI